MFCNSLLTVRLVLLGTTIIIRIIKSAKSARGVLFTTDFKRPPLGISLRVFNQAILGGLAMARKIVQPTSYALVITWVGCKLSSKHIPTDPVHSQPNPLRQGCAPQAS